MNASSNVHFGPWTQPIEAGLLLNIPVGDLVSADRPRKAVASMHEIVRCAPFWRPDVADERKIGRVINRTTWEAAA